MIQGLFSSHILLSHHVEVLKTLYQSGGGLAYELIWVSLTILDVHAAAYVHFWRVLSILVIRSERLPFLLVKLVLRPEPVKPVENPILDKALAAVIC